MVSCSPSVDATYSLHCVVERDLAETETMWVGATVVRWREGSGDNVDGWGGLSVPSQLPDNLHLVLLSPKHIHIPGTDAFDRN